MSIIKLLDDNLINQIAAGEVVERPASVVKELLENSIDAGAKNIVVELLDAGTKMIKVTDDGVGMSEDDIEMAFVRHATSKIKNESDLWNIHTLGFRGEAVASISSVSQMTIRSKQADAVAGYEVNSDGGNIMTKEQYAMDQGTQIEVRSLFFNTPARQKYLKKESTEFGHVSSVFTTITLSNLDVNFKLIHNGKVLFDLARVSDFRSRISDIFGVSTADAMIDIFYGGTDMKIDGLVGKPSISRSSSKHQYFFVNGRAIRHGVLANMVKQAYKSMLMEHRNPVFFINIEIPPEEIDVNVHPRKLEIRFVNQQKMIKVIYAAVKAALDRANLTPKGFTESRRYMSDSFPSDDHGEKTGFSGSATGQKNTLPGGSDGIARRDALRGAGAGFGGGFGFGRTKNSTVQDAMDFTKNFITDRESQSIVDETPKLRAITQISNSYIIAQNEEGLVLIDQHAGHERVRYEQLMEQFENQKKSVQPLLLPHSIELSHDELLLVEDNINVFEELGFEIEPFGGKTFVINAVPKFFAKEDIEDVFRGVIDDVITHKSVSKFQGKTEEIITYMSCRSAIKFGQKLDLSEMQALINQMDKLVRPYTCPHGRPTMVALTLQELEKMFGRK